MNPFKLGCNIALWPFLLLTKVGFKGAGYIMDRPAEIHNARYMRMSLHNFEDLIIEEHFERMGRRILTASGELDEFSRAAHMSSGVFLKHGMSFSPGNDPHFVEDRMTETGLRLVDAYLDSLPPRDLCAGNLEAMIRSIENAPREQTQRTEPTAVGWIDLIYRQNVFLRNNTNKGFGTPIFYAGDLLRRTINRLLNDYREYNHCHYSLVLENDADHESRRQMIARYILNGHQQGIDDARFNRVLAIAYLYARYLETEAVYDASSDSSLFGRARSRQASADYDHFEADEPDLGTLDGLRESYLIQKKSIESYRATKGAFVPDPQKLREMQATLSKFYRMRQEALSTQFGEEEMPFWKLHKKEEILAEGGSEPVKYRPMDLEGTPEGPLQQWQLDLRMLYLIGLVYMKDKMIIDPQIADYASRLPVPAFIEAQLNNWPNLYTLQGAHDFVEKVRQCSQRN